MTNYNDTDIVLHFSNGQVFFLRSGESTPEYWNHLEVIHVSKP